MSHANHSIYSSPFGALWLTSKAGKLTRLAFANHPEFPNTPSANTCELLHEAAQQLTAYFNGKLTRFTLPLAPQGTAFQHDVWNALSAIPHGNTESYGSLAQQLQRPRAYRAVGGAANRNPIAIIIPCHRLLGQNGALTGFAGGLATKRWLLRHEGWQGE
jgi:methylated-DNA-[protein]-cysteine S-methyltransferase